jgi:hypothetical protein
MKNLTTLFAGGEVECRWISKVVDEKPYYSFRRKRRRH